MSETETETEDETGEDGEREPIEPPAPGEDDEEAAETAAAQAAKDGSAEVAKKLERAVSDHKRRLTKILDTDLEGCECPTCDGVGYTPGGLGEEPQLVHPDNLVPCEACNGYGEVITGSKHPNHATVFCTICSGLGYITQSAQPTNVHTLPTAPPSPAAAQAGTLLADGRFLPFGATEPIVIAPTYPT